MTMMVGPIKNLSKPGQNSDSKRVSENAKAAENHHQHRHDTRKLKELRFADYFAFLIFGTEI